MSEEFQTQKNTVATVGMRFSIIGLIALITVFFAWLGLPLLIVGFILGIIGLFYKPRGKARVAVCIPLVIFIIIASVICYIGSSIKAPANEFGEWAETRLGQIDEESFDNERFNAITNEEFNNIFSTMSEEDWTSIIETSTGSNIIEKASYAIFGLLQQGLENSLTRYENGEFTEFENDSNFLEVEIEKNDSENNTEINNQEPESVEVFTQSEQNNIEEFLNILE